MRDSSFHLMIPPKIALVILLSLAPCISAAPPEAPAPVPALESTDSPVDDGEALKQGSRNSLTLSHRQAVIQYMELAREAVERKDYLTALPYLERALAEPNSFIPLGPVTEIAAHEDVRRLLQQIPSDLRQRLDEPRRVSSRRAWEQARAGGSAEVVAFLQQFGDLPLGVDALWWLGCHERDHAQSQLAATAFARVAEHPQATDPQRAIALVVTIELLLAANQQSTATAVSQRLSQLDPNLVIGLGERTLTLKQWLSEQGFDRPTPRAATSSDLSMAVANGRLHRPVLPPVWKHPFDVPLGPRLLAREQKQRDQGIRPIPLQRPTIIGDQVIVRSLDLIQSFQLATGEPRWTIPNIEFQQFGHVVIDNPSFQSAALDWAQRRGQADSLFTRMSSDGRRLFVIQEPDRKGEFTINPTTGPHRVGPRYNKLCGYSIDTGALEWDLGGPPSLSNSTFAGLFFLGCPMVVDDVLYVVVQREIELQLLALDPRHGSLIWSIALGTARLPITEDLLRSRVACPIVWHEGLLLCSTSAGAVVAIDPLLRTMKWGYRYSATTIAAGDLQSGPNPQDTRPNSEAWWDAWREPFAAVLRLDSIPTEERPGASGDSTMKPSLLIFASPETDLLHAVGTSGGDPLWTVPRGGGLFVAGIAEQRVVVIEGDFVRGHDVATGQQIWRTAISEIGGPGCLIGPVLVLAAQSGGTMLLDIRNGQLLSESSNVDSTLGSLTENSEAWIACSRQSVMRLPRLTDVRQGVDQELQHDPHNESLRVRAAFLDLQAGDIVAARGRLDGLESSPARELRRESLIEALKDSETKRLDGDRSDLARQLKELAEDVDYKFAAAAAIGASAMAVADLTAAVDAALDGLTADLDQPEGLVRAASTVVRKDRVLLGLIDEAYRRANPSERTALDELFMNRLKEAKKSRDRMAVQRLENHWRGLDWSRRLVILEEEKTLRKRSPTEIELRLLDASGSNDSSIAAQALERLAQRFDRAGAAQDAYAARLRLLRERPSATFPDGATVADRIARDPIRNDALSTAVKSIWPNVEPKVESRDDRTFSVYQLIPVHAEPGSLAERLDISVDRSNGNEVLFRGDAFFQVGQDEEHERKFLLPRTASPYRGSTGHPLRRAWGIGRIVVLMVGSELFGIAPLDEHGEPNSQFLWPNPIDLQSSASDVRVVTGRSGSSEGRPRVVDQSNRPIGRVGPVRASYFCYQKGTKLVAAETETGLTLWERLDLPPDVTVVGDDHFVFLWRTNKTLEKLSVIDGRKIEERVWEASPSHLIHQRDSLVWTAVRGEQMRLELHDLRTGELVWSRVDPRNTQIGILDPETFGLATPDGQFHVLTARTGTPQCDPLAINTQSITGIMTWQDTERWYVALTRPAANRSMTKNVRPNDSYQVRFVTGTLFAVDRYRPQIAWQRELKQEPISLEQSRAAPVLIQLWKPPPSENMRQGEALLRVIDKRTGKIVIEGHQDDLTPYFLLNPDPQQAILELKLAHETIQMNYATD